MTLFCLRLKNAIRITNWFYRYSAYSLILRAHPHKSIFLHSWANVLFCSLTLKKLSAFVLQASSSLFLASYCSFCILERASARFCLFWSLNSITFTFKSRFCSLRIPISFWDACNYSLSSTIAYFVTSSATLLSSTSEKSAKCSTCFPSSIFLVSPKVW